MELLRLLRLSMANALTSRQYQVFVLHFLEGIPQREIASELSMTRSGVSRCYREAAASLWAFWKLEDKRDIKHKITDCLEDVLTEKEFRVFIRRFFSGTQAKEIAAEDEISHSAASRTYNAALNRLRRLWISEEVDSS
ncbi:sigma factor-like helix-turn-helix DNA-binding protein [Butyricicoccus sp.]|uniref:sigma factor-like helix-turn-helix DNA-binding protein n=1 Tax=Butyricicoccus sp. TaxID=2049021 RepID=UPI003F16FBC5